MASQSRPDALEWLYLVIFSALIVWLTWQSYDPHAMYDYIVRPPRP